MIQKLIVFQKIKNTIERSNKIKKNEINHKEKTNTDKNMIYNKISEKYIFMNKVLQKIKLKTKTIYDLYNEKLLISKQFHFTKWREIGKNKKYIEGIKTESEKKVKSKYSTKIEEFETILKKMNQESIAYKTKIDDFERNFINHQKKINGFEIKEKEFFKQSKFFTGERKKKLDNLDLFSIELKAKCAEIENYIKELEKSYQTEMENQTEKELFLINYINEMNSLLDFYEMKSSNFPLTLIKILFKKFLLFKIFVKISNLKTFR